MLRFASNFEAPFENNQAEHEVRIVKQRQKISGRFRRDEGCEMFCRIRGYISIVRKQSCSLLSSIVNVFDRSKPMPELVTM